MLKTAQILAQIIRKSSQSINKFIDVQLGAHKASLAA